MEKKFTSDEVPLARCSRTRSRRAAAPDFQRGWVWDDDHIASLLASISLSYPIGAVMTLQTGNPDVRFRPRPLEGVELRTPIEPEFLLLDGQQRTTSLYLALKSGRAGADPGRSKGNDFERRYFADIRACLDPFADREEAIVGVPADGRVKNFRGEVTARRLDAGGADRRGDVPARHRARPQPRRWTGSWRTSQSGPGEQAERLETWKRSTRPSSTPSSSTRCRRSSS